MVFAVPAGHILHMIEPILSVYVPGKQLEQLTFPKVAEPSEHCIQVAEPSTETAPFGQVIQDVLNIEKSFGFAVLTGHLRHVGLFIEEQMEFK